MYQALGIYRHFAGRVSEAQPTTSQGLATGGFHPPYKIGMLPPTFILDCREVAFVRQAVTSNGKPDGQNKPSQPSWFLHN
jgi:hypothetical protein